MTSLARSSIDLVGAGEETDKPITSFTLALLESDENVRTLDNLYQAEAKVYSCIRLLDKIIEEYSEQEIQNTIK